MNHRTWNLNPSIIVAAVLIATTGMVGNAHAASPTARPRAKAADCPPPYIEKGEWKDDPYGPILEMTPTYCGRQLNNNEDTVARDRDFHALVGEMVIKFSTNRHLVAGLPTAINQLLCHARLFPDKPTWNVETERPYVSYEKTVAAECNPSTPDPDMPVQ